MALRTLPDQRYLCECFDYDPETGIVRWKERPQEHFRSKRVWMASNTSHAGKVAGSPSVDGMVIMLDQRGYRLHRLIWKIHYGTDAPPEIDHWDNDWTNNRISNLRAATPEQNRWNMRRSSQNNTGYKGVYAERGKFGARIRGGGRRIFLGHFDTAEEAHAHYCRAARRLHGTFWNKG